MAEEAEEAEEEAEAEAEEDEEAEEVMVLVAAAEVNSLGSIPMPGLRPILSPSHSAVPRVSYGRMTCLRIAWQL